MSVQSRVRQVLVLVVVLQTTSAMAMWSWIPFFGRKTETKQEIYEGGTQGIIEEQTSSVEQLTPEDEENLAKRIAPDVPTIIVERCTVSLDKTTMSIEGANQENVTVEKQELEKKEETLEPGFVKTVEKIPYDPETGSFDKTVTITALENKEVITLVTEEPEKKESPFNVYIRSFCALLSSMPQENFDVTDMSLEDRAGFILKPGHLERNLWGRSFLGRTLVENDMKEIGLKFGNGRHNLLIEVEGEKLGEELVYKDVCRRVLGNYMVAVLQTVSETTEKNECVKKIHKKSDKAVLSWCATVAKLCDVKLSPEEMYKACESLVQSPKVTLMQGFAYDKEYVQQPQSAAFFFTNGSTAIISVQGASSDVHRAAILKESIRKIAKNTQVKEVMTLLHSKHLSGYETVGFKKVADLIRYSAQQ